MRKPSFTSAAYIVGLNLLLPAYAARTFADEPGLQATYFQKPDGAEFDLIESPFQYFFKRFSRAENTGLRTTWNVGATSYAPGGSTGGLAKNNFAVRWEGFLNPNKTGSVSFCVCHPSTQFDNQGNVGAVASSAAIWLNGQRVYNVPIESNNHNQNNAVDTSLADPLTGNFYLQQGKPVKIRVEYMINRDSVDSHSFFALGWKTKGTCALVNTSSCEAAMAQPLDPKDPNRFSKYVNAQLTDLEIIPATAFQTSDQLNQVYNDCEPKTTLLPKEQWPNPADPAVDKAKRLFKRLAGIDVPLADSRVAQVAALLKTDTPESRIAAARVVTAEPSFYDLTVRAFAAPLSNRDLTPNWSLNDFTATVIGVTRDRLDSRLLLTGDFLYRAKPEVFWGGEIQMFSRRALLETSRVSSQTTDHYARLDHEKTPLKCALNKVDKANLNNLPLGFLQEIPVAESGNSIYGGSATTVNSDPAGVLTSWSWGLAHVTAGTNRRPVEKAFENFLCAPIDSWRDSTTDSSRIGRDVTRFPSGGYPRFVDTCKSCHGQLDALRGAWAHLDFDETRGHYKSTYFFDAATVRTANGNTFCDTNDILTTNNPSGTICKQTSVPRVTGDQNGTGNVTVDHVLFKMNRNASNYPSGYIMTDNSWENFVTGRSNADYFGWRGQMQGKGIREFGRMLTNTTRFPKCMARKVYTSVCKTTPSAEVEQGWLAEVARQFEANGYQLKDLFEVIGVNCL